MPSHFCKLVIAGAVLLPSAAHSQGPATEEFVAPSRSIEPTIPASLDTDSRALVDATNAFSLDLLHTEKDFSQNLIVSPASVSIAVGLAYRGAAGDTASQLRQVLRYPFDPVRNLKASGAMMDTMSFSATGRDLRTANALWVQDGMPFNDTYERDMATHAKAGFERIDFGADPEAARQRINRWVADATRDNIEELLTTGTVSRVRVPCWSMRCGSKPTGKILSTRRPRNKGRSPRLTARRRYSR